MLTNIWLLEKHVGIVEWPNAMGETSPVRGEYIGVLEAADNGDYDPLVELQTLYSEATSCCHSATTGQPVHA